MNLDDAIARRDRAGRIVRTMVVAIAGAVLATVALSLYYLVDVAAQLQDVTASTHAAAAQVADCTTPRGKCYERGRASTAVAVGQIIGALNKLDAQRGQSSKTLQAGQDQIRAALRQLCQAQNLSCPSLR